MNQADLVVADGQPLVWALRLLGVRQRRRVRVSPDLLLRLFAEAHHEAWSIGLYGGTDETLKVFSGVPQRALPPALRVPLASAPPFRPLTAKEDEEVVGRIRSSRCAIASGGARLSKAGTLDGRTRGASDRHDRSRCGLRSPRGPNQRGAALDQRHRHGVGLPARPGAATAMAWRLKNDPRFLALLGSQVVRRFTDRGR